MHVAGAEEDRLAGLEAHVVEQQGEHDADVAGEVGGHESHRPGNPGPFLVSRAERRVGEDGADERCRVVEAQQRGERRAQAAGTCEQATQWRELGDVPRVEQAQRVLDRPEAAQCLERRERAEQLRLVVGVAVVALRCVARDAGGVLGGEPGPRLLDARVHLDRQRGLHGQHLEQERQARPEPCHGRCAEQPVGLGGEECIERRAACRHGRRGVGVRAEPELGRRFAVGRDAEQVRDRRPRAPRVVADHAVERDHCGHRHRRILRGRALRRSRSGSR